MAVRVLSVAESDSCGGAGIQADVKTIFAFGGYATTAITHITAQNSLGIVDFQSCSPEFVVKQMRTVLDDFGTDAIKISTLDSKEMINSVSDLLDEIEGQNYPIIVDPSIVSRSGDILLDQEGIATLKRRLILRTTLLTPNRKEAELLTGMTINDLDNMRHATDMMRTLGAEAVVLKGGQISGDKVVNLVSCDEGEKIFETPVLNVKHTHGAGCSLSSALATRMAQGSSIFGAMEDALSFLNTSIETAHDYGQGTGPINHLHMIN